MSKYIHKAAGCTATAINPQTYVLMYENEHDESNGTLASSSVIHNPYFGWEKVEEFQGREWMRNKARSSYLECLYRYKKGRGSDEYYCIDDEGVLQGHGKTDNITKYDTKATPEQIERILSIVARHKGYKEGVLVESVCNGSRARLSFEDFRYESYDDILYLGGYCIYSKGTWATILPEKATEPQVEAVHEYTCVEKHLRCFTEGKVYLFKEKDGIYVTTNDHGVDHSMSGDKMSAWFDMGQDWKTAKVFSPTNILDMAECDMLHLEGIRYLLIKQSVLEEEAKKRTQL